MIMRKNYFKTTTFAMMLVLIAGFTNRISAQDVRYVDVAPGIGTLNEAINGDTTDTGARVDSFNTVYRLQRVEDIYYISELIENIDYPLTVIAEEGEGPKPYLALKTDADGNNPGYCFRAKGDLTIKGLHLTLLDDLGAVEQRVVRASADDITIVVDDCWFDRASGNAFRIDNGGNSLFLTNSVFSNIGDPASPGVGRAIDDRGNDIDTIIIEDCTFYNITSRFLRDDGGYIKYFKVNQCNFVNAGNERGFDFGTIAGMEFTNNILHNVFAVPNDTGQSAAILMVDGISQELLDMGLTQTIIVSNNSIYLDTTLVEEYLNDSTTVGRIFNFSAETWASVDSSAIVNGFIYENVNFENPPADADIKNIIDYEWDESLLVEDTPYWTIPAPTNGVYHLDVPFSFNYANTVAATGATDGGQLGDRNWTASSSVGIAPAKQFSNSMRIYPTPASSNVNVEFSIENRGLVQMEVYNLSGKKVHTLINQMYPAGSHQLNWDLTGKLEAGIYLLKMKAGDKISASKMIVK
jgi:hypothetical protein